MATELTEVSYTVKTMGAKLLLVSPSAGKTLAPAEISPQVLRMLCEDAGKYFSAKVDKAVHTEPAFSKARVLAEFEEFRKDMQAKLDELEAREEPVPGPQAELVTGPRAWGAPSAGFLESLRRRPGR